MVEVTYRNAGLLVTEQQTIKVFTHEREAAVNLRIWTIFPPVSRGILQTDLRNLAEFTAEIVGL